MILRTNLGLGQRQHLGGGLRIGEALESALFQRLKVMMGTPRFAPSWRGATCAGYWSDILAEEKDAIRSDRSRRGSPCLPARRWFRAELPRCSRGTCSMNPAGCLSRAGRTAPTCRTSRAKPGRRRRALPRLHRSFSGQFPISANASSQATGTCRSTVVAHRIGQAASLFEIVVGPGLGRHFMSGEELGCTRLVVSPRPVALAPFSQNSKGPWMPWFSVGAN